jgi:hypothetical protein
MTGRLELLLVDGGQAIPLGESPLHVGRGPANQVVLGDDTVSWNHAEVWLEGGRAWVRDLGSRNGTFRNGEALTAPEPVQPGDTLRFGKRVQACVRLPLGFDAPEPYRVLQLEELATGHQFMLRSSRFHVGSGSDAHLKIDGAPARAATLMLNGDEVWVGTADEEFQVQVGEEFSIAGRRMRIVEARVDHVPTVDLGAARYPYVARAVANGPLGPEVWLEEPQGGARHHADGNRAILLVILARALARDREAHALEEDEGWVSDEDLRTGIWGRGGGSKSALNVLVHRTRKQLETDGFDPWFLEKTRRGLRARLREVKVESVR